MEGERLVMIIANEIKVLANYAAKLIEENQLGYQSKLNPDVERILDSPLAKNFNF
jgi:hypothetical protein